jgi:hypothetical protein
MAGNNSDADPRTRASGAISDGWPATSVPDSVAPALEVHPMTTAMTTAAMRPA